MIFVPANMTDNQLFSSFMMLNEHLYGVFVQYILNGRTRAPPETELIAILPTFQFGAKTDRRALQSKFKSWAKRMNFENGCLVLANTGKIIIPSEFCDDLIVMLHSKEHADIDNIINQIRKTYTWTRKNFGMDRDIVVESILRNCKKEECIKKMRLETAKLGNSFCSGMPNIPLSGMIPEMSLRMPPPLPYFTPYHYPLPIPISPVFSPRRYPFPIPFFKDMRIPEIQKSSIDETNGIATLKKDAPISTFSPKIDKKAKENSIAIAHSSSNNVNSANKVMAVKFRKPKNAHEYKNLMEAVRKYPKSFPNILATKKNQFLASLGIAPKVICSSRTLRKFRKELRHKQFMTRDCMIYRERKMLRDKNKLKKFSNQQKKHLNYLGFTFPRKSTMPLSRAENLASKQSQLHEAEENVGEKNNHDSNSKKIKLFDDKKEKSTELITIDSSDEECAEKNDFLPDEEDALERDTDRLSSTETYSNNQSLENDTLENNEKELSTKYYVNLDDKGNTEEKLKRKNCNIDLSQAKSIIEQKLRNGTLKDSPILLPINSSNLAQNKPPNDQTKLPNEKYFSVPQFAVLQPTNANSTLTVVKETTSLPLQPSTTFTASGQSNAARIVYPIKLTKATPANVVLLDKEQKGAYFVVPTYNKSGLPLNSPGMHLPNVTISKALGISSPMFYPQIRQLKPKSKDSEIIGNYRKLFVMGDSSKTDISEEMSRITGWIYRMKSILNPCTLNNGAEKSVQKLLSQLDFGIHLVKEAKKTLKEIDPIIDTSKASTEIAE